VYHEGSKNTKCLLFVKKAIPGLFSIGQHPKTPRVVGVAGRRFLRRQTSSTVCEAGNNHFIPQSEIEGCVFLWHSMQRTCIRQSLESFQGGAHVFETWGIPRRPFFVTFVFLSKIFILSLMPEQFSKSRHGSLLETFR